MERNVLVNLLHVKKYYVKKKRFFHKPATYTKAVDDITLQIYEGETLGIVGESGCGKSTLGKLFVGLEPVSDGEIFYKNENFQKKEIRKKNRTNVQMVFQNTSASLNPRKKIYDLLYAPLHYHHIVPKTNINQEIDRLLNLVGLNSNMKKRFPHEFSGGQRQRIGIARALSVKPKFVVWDEPVSALDASVLASILNLIKNLQKELDLTSVFIGHGLTSVRYVSDRIAVMYLGKIVEIAKADEIFRHPIHPYTKALFSAAPILDPKKRAKDRFILSGEVMAGEKDLVGEPTKGCIFYSRCPFAQSFCKEQPMQLALLEEVANAYDAHYCACPVKMKEEKI